MKPKKKIPTLYASNLLVKEVTAANTETVPSPEKIKWLRDHGGGAISC